MDQDVWARILRATRLAARRVMPSVRTPKFPDLLIVRMYCWSVWHDRSLMWAASREHYGRLFRPRKLPSVSQFARRVKTLSVQTILQRVHEDLAEVHRMSAVLYLDGKPLAVSPVSKDPDAGPGHIAGGFGKGYKLHARVSEDLRIICWSVMPLNVAEQSVAMELLARHPTPNSLLMADSNYDSAPFYKATQWTNATLFTQLKGQKRVKNNQHHPVTLRQMGAARREAVRIWKQHPDLCRFVLRQRDAIERTFSALTCYGGGLAPLPSWVRTLQRVRRWVGTKIILYHARLQARRAAKIEVAV
jgi:hypothetical protein